MQKESTAFASVQNIITISSIYNIERAPPMIRKHPVFMSDRKFGLQLVLIGFFAILLCSPALAEDCNLTGDSITCSNGLSGQRIGNSTYWNDGTSSQRIGNSTYSSDGTSSQTIGNNTYYSDGTSSQRIGSFTYFSDGRSCQRIANQIVCD